MVDSPKLIKQMQKPFTGYVEWTNNSLSLNLKPVIISLTNDVNLTAIGLIVSKNQSLSVRKI